MLQVISGKFFTTEELYAFDAKSVLFSNYQWIDKIDTSIGTIEPIHPFNDIVATYVFQYRNQIEKEKSEPLVRTGDEEITDQFRLLCMFWFRAYFNKEKNLVERYCQHIPSSQPFSFFPVFVPRYFDRHIHGVLTEAEGFPAFVEKVLWLERRAYEQVICSLRHLFDALELSSMNIDLAYSMLVYVLESYSQTFDGYEPIWNDYDPTTKTKLDAALKDIDIEKGNRIREILVASANFKAQQRMLDYVETAIDSDYFLQPSQDIKAPLRRSELKQALRNAYSLRSGFTHELKPIQEQLTNPRIGEFDTFPWEGQAYLTFGGLFRLTYYIIQKFISSQPVVTQESYDYQNHFPKVIHMEMSPQYWIGYTGNFHGSVAPKHLSALLQLSENVAFRDGHLMDITALCERIEEIYYQSENRFRPSLFAIYYLYNSSVPEEFRSQGYELFISRNFAIFDECSIEALISLLLTGRSWDWDSATCESVILKYLGKKYSANSLRIPMLFEIGMVTHLANRFLDSGRYEKYAKWLRYALTDLPGNFGLQMFIQKCLDQGDKVDFFGFIRTSAPGISPNM